MVRVCLDLPMLLNYLKGEPKAVEKLQIYLQRKDVELSLSALTLADLYIIIRDPSLVERLEEHFAILPFNDEAAAKARLVYDALEEQRVAFSPRQVFLAAVCLAHDAILLTDDRVTYKNVPGLKIV